MAIRTDPAQNGRRALLDLAALDGGRILEIGSGDGRFTWTFADRAEHVTAIDPDAEQIVLARQSTPAHLRDRVDFQHVGFEDFAASRPPAAFDVVILSWSLC